MSLNKKFMLIVMGLISTPVVIGQSARNSAVYDAYDAIVSMENTGLFNGTEFKDIYNNTDKTHRYFNLFDFSKGTVVYDGQTYTNVFLKYDLLDDQLITRSNDNMSVFSIQLLPEKISSFSMYGHDFVRLTNTQLSGDKNGIYEIGYKGKTIELFVKNIKTKKDKAVGSAVQYRFKADNHFVIRVDDTFKVIQSYRDFKDILPDQYEQVREFYKSYKAMNKSNPKAFMTKLVTYLDGGFGSTEK